MSKFKTEEQKSAFGVRRLIVIIVITTRWFLYIC